MSRPNKRHYRVAQRDKDIVEEQCVHFDENIDKIFTLGCIMYLCTALLSLTLGYIIGKNQ